LACAGYLAHPFLEKNGFYEQMYQVASTGSKLVTEDWKPVGSGTIIYTFYSYI